jgi:hypothetical protein
MAPMVDKDHFSDWGEKPIINHCFARFSVNIYESVALQDFP